MLLNDASFEKGYMKNWTQLISITSLVIEISHRKQGRHRRKKNSRKNLIYFCDQLVVVVIWKNSEQAEATLAGQGKPKCNQMIFQCSQWNHCTLQLMLGFQSSETESWFKCQALLKTHLEFKRCRFWFCFSSQQKMWALSPSFKAFNPLTWIFTKLNIFTKPLKAQNISCDHHRELTEGAHNHTEIFKRSTFTWNCFATVFQHLREVTGNLEVLSSLACMVAGQETAGTCCSMGVFIWI